MTPARRMTRPRNTAPTPATLRTGPAAGASALSGAGNA